jgi:ligand-binding sensor domain-containing protein/two-component sensor histidine kinase
MKVEHSYSFYLVFLLALVATVVVAQGQQYSGTAEAALSRAWGHKVWSSENGLPQNSVHQLFQSHDGYLWIATEGGIARFNGIQFTVFNQESEPAFTSNDTCCLTEDRNGDLWIGTSDGLVRYTGGVFRRYGTPDGLPSSVVTSLAPTKDGFFLVLTSGGLAKYDGRKFTLTDLSVTALGVGPDKEVWFSTSAGLVGQDGEHSRRAPVPNLPTEPIEGLGSLPDGSQWVRTRTALLLWNRNRFKTWNAGRELPGTRVQSFFADSRGTLWVGTDQGLVMLSANNGGLENVSALSGTSILTIFEDREHNLWVGTDTAGLHMLRKQRFLTLPALAGRAVTTIMQTADRTIWLGTKDDGLFQYEGGRIHHFTTKNGLISDVILTLVADGDGSLWVGTPDGLNHLQGVKIESYTSAEGLPDDFIRSLFADTDGSLWVGTRRGLAHRQGSGRFSVFSRADGFKSDLIGAMLRSSSNDLWVGTLDGLVRIRDEKFTVFTTADGLSDNAVTSLLEDANHTLWIGTNGGGLSRLSANGFSPVYAPSIPREIDALLEDARGYLWLTSKRGIIRVSASELMACVDTKTCNPHISAYGSSDGMPSEETSLGGHPGAWRTTEGQLWFATRKGVAIADPAELLENQSPPPVVIERFTVDDTAFGASATETTIPPGRGRYAFEYVGLSYVSPLRVRYRYILDGFDKQWTEAGSRRNAYYTNLPPRHYRFRVQAANEDGVWSEEGAEISFIIKPPVYRTVWFVALATLLLIGIIFAIYRLRVRGISSRFEAILAERTRIAREIHDTLAQDLVGVSVQLELTAHLLAQSDVVEAREQVDRTRSLVQQGLADARRSIWNLRSADTRSTLPRRLSRLLEKNSDEHLKADANISGVYRALGSSVENEIFRIAQEAIANVVRHASATRVVLDLRYRPNDLTLTISDNGIGFHGTEPGQVGAGHFGLQGMRERANQISGTLIIESCSDMGTTVTLSVPLLDGKE